MWINSVLIVLLNSAVIVIILRHKKKSRLYFLLLNLAVADLVTGLIDALPNAVERSVGLPYYETLWVFGAASCKIQRALASVSMTSSNYILAVMSLDRAMVIYSPMRAFRKGKLLHKVTMLVCWTLSALCCSPLLKFMDVTPADLAPSGYFTCSIDWGDLDHMLMWKMLTIVMFIIVFAIPLAIIAISYVILLVSIYSLSKMTDQGTPEHRPSFLVFNSGLPRSKAKSIRLTFGIILSFIICWLIFFAFVFANVFGGYNGSFILVAMTFYYWNSVANPTLFFIYHRNRTFSSRNSLNAQNGVSVKWNGPILKDERHDVLRLRLEQRALMIATTFYYWNSVADPALFFIYHRNRTFSSRNSLNAQNGGSVKWNGPILKDDRRKTTSCFVVLCLTGVVRIFKRMNVTCNAFTGQIVKYIAMMFYYWNSVANPALFFIYHGNMTCSSRNSLNAQNGVSVKWNGPILEDDRRKTTSCFVVLCLTGVVRIFKRRNVTCNAFTGQIVKYIAMMFYYWNSLANPALFFIYHGNMTCSSRNSLNAQNGVSVKWSGPILKDDRRKTTSCCCGAVFKRGGTDIQAKECNV